MYGDRYHANFILLHGIVQFSQHHLLKRLSFLSYIVSFITSSTKVHLVKAMFFPVDMYRCESWTIKLSTEELMLLTCGVGEDS